MKSQQARIPTRVVIVGARQHAKVVCHILTTSTSITRGIKVVGFVDDNPDLFGSTLLGYPILGQFGDLDVIRQKLDLQGAIMGISNLHMDVRKRYFEEFKILGLEPVSAIHEAAIVEDTAKIGKGIVLNPNCVINAYATVGNNIVAYSGVTIEHEDIVGDNVYLGPGVNFASGVKVGDDTFIGAGTCVIPDIVIGKGVTIGAGSVIIEDVPDKSVVVGNPGKVIKVKE